MPTILGFAPSSNGPNANLHTLWSPWSFMQWGLDVVGLLPHAQTQLRFLLDATDYFTKWVEAVPLLDIMGQQIIKFLWQNIVNRFKLPHSIISAGSISQPSK